jgi:hypothetical protein
MLNYTMTSDPADGEVVRLVRMAHTQDGEPLYVIHVPRWMSRGAAEDEEIRRKVADAVTAILREYPLYASIN